MVVAVNLVAVDYPPEMLIHRLLSWLHILLGLLPKQSDLLWDLLLLGLPLLLLLTISQCQVSNPLMTAQLG